MSLVVSHLLCSATPTGAFLLERVVRVSQGSYISRTILDVLVKGGKNKALERRSLMHLNLCFKMRIFIKAFYFTNRALFFNPQSIRMKNASHGNVPAFTKSWLRFILMMQKFKAHTIILDMNITLEKLFHLPHVMRY